MSPICCQRLSVHIAYKHVVQTGEAYCFVSTEGDKRILIPIGNCPWCGAELQPVSERPYAMSMPARSV